MFGGPGGPVVAASSVPASESPRKPQISRLYYLDRKTALLLSCSRCLTWPRQPYVPALARLVRGGDELDGLAVYEVKQLEGVYDGAVFAVGEVGSLRSGCCE